MLDILGTIAIFALMAFVLVVIPLAILGVVIAYAFGSKKNSESESHSAGPESSASSRASKNSDSV